MTKLQHLLLIFFGLSLGFVSNADAARYKCISGGVPVYSDSPKCTKTQVTSYAGYSCGSQQICNPFVFGVKSNGQPYCFNSTKSCYKKIKVTKGAITPVLKKRGAREAYTAFKKERSSFCASKLRSTSNACRYINKQVQTNERRGLSIATTDAADIKRQEANRKVLAEREQKAAAKAERIARAKKELTEKLNRQRAELVAKEQAAITKKQEAFAEQKLKEEEAAAIQKALVEAKEKEAKAKAKKKQEAVPTVSQTLSRKSKDKEQVAIENERRERLKKNKIPTSVLKESAKSLKTYNPKPKKGKRASSAKTTNPAQNAKTIGRKSIRACGKKMIIPRKKLVSINYSRRYQSYRGPFKIAMRQLISKYKSGVRSVSCTRRKQSSADALICNCANETSAKDASMVEVNRTVLTRTIIKGRPNTIRGVIWQRSQFSWTLPRAPRRKGAYPYMSHKKVKGVVLKKCILASMKAIDQGPNGMDHYLNSHIAQPRWFRGRKKCNAVKRGVYAVGRHIFSKSRSKFKKKNLFDRFKNMIGVSTGGVVE